MGEHTYDSLRALARVAVTTPSVDAPGALDVLQDALRESGVLINSDSLPEWERFWSMKWAMKAVYGPAQVCTQTLEIGPRYPFGPDHSTPDDHRRWTEERIAHLRERGAYWAPKKRAAKGRKAT